MVITELDNIQYLNFIKLVFADRGFNFLVLAVGREAEHRHFYRDLREDWSSIDDVTEKKIAFLHFTLSKNDRSDKGYIDAGYGERIYSNGITIDRTIELPQSKYLHKGGIDYYNDLIRKHNIPDAFEIIHKPMMPKLFWRQLYNPASDLLAHFKKSERDLPFLYVYDLRGARQFFISYNDIYTSYISIYHFLKELKNKIEEELIIKSELSSIDRTIRLYPLTKDSQNIIEYGHLLIRKAEKGTLKNHEIINFYIRIGVDIDRQKSDLTQEIKYIGKELNDFEIKIKGESEAYRKFLVPLDNRRALLTTELRHLYTNFLTLNKSKGQMSTMPVRFKFAFTFSGTTRPYVEKVALELRSLIAPEEVFYDNFFKGKLARLDLDTYLQDIYHDRSEYIVVFLTADYEQKEWCGLEWRAIRDLIKSKQANKIILIKMEDFKLPGIFSIDGYLSGQHESPEQVAKLILERIG